MLPNLHLKPNDKYFVISWHQNSMFQNVWYTYSCQLQVPKIDGQPGISCLHIRYLHDVHIRAKKQFSIGGIRRQYFLFEYLLVIFQTCKSKYLSQGFQSLTLYRLLYEFQESYFHTNRIQSKQKATLRLPATSFMRFTVIPRNVATLQPERKY